jgi:tetratricopeptide (TPR) repeat protein
MKLSNARIRTAMILGIVVASSAGCTLVNKIRAKNQLNEAARAYKENRRAEAEDHARRALELDPNNKVAPIFIARILHAQYATGVDTPENIAKAKEAIAAYQKILQNDPNGQNSEEAYKAVAALYGAIKEEQKLREWISQRANDPNMPSEKRSEAYAVLAGKDWYCSFEITERPESKQVQTGGATKVVYKKPKDPKDFDAAQKCSTQGLEEANKAIQLDPNNEPAWSYMMSLYTEKAKLAEMDGKMDQKTQYEKKADDARKQDLVLTKRKEEAAAAASSGPATQ